MAHQPISELSMAQEGGAQVCWKRVPDGSSVKLGIPRQSLPIG